MDAIDFAKILTVSIKDHIPAGVFVIVVLLSLVQVSKIKWNPWDSIFGWFGSKLNSGIKKELDDLKNTLNSHIDEYEKEKLETSRQTILDFCHSCMVHERHTREQFNFIIKRCDQYEEYVEKNHIKNGEITSAIKEIHRLYDLCIQNNSFLIEGQDPN